MKTVYLKLISAISIRGVIVNEGEIIEVDEENARSLLHREVAVLATHEDAPAEAAPEVETEAAPAEESAPADEESAPAEAAPESKPRKK